ncbi:MAG: hypothetical protein JRE70_11835 [Deltaproteobacteria bacterium]|nr:hypothetical protein [Deltaproteobacteria bacterium]
MGTHDTRSRAGFDGAVRRAGTFLSGLLPGLLPALLAVNTLLAIASPVGAEDTAAAETSSGSMQKMIDQQLDKIPSGDEGVNQIMGELTDKLTLTPDQQKDIRPSIVDTVAAMEKSRDRFRAGEITPMAMAMQVQMAGQKAAVLPADDAGHAAAAARRWRRRGGRLAVALSAVALSVEDGP